MNVRSMISKGCEVLSEAGIECSRNDAMLLAQYVLSCDYTGLIMSYADEVSCEQYDRYISIIEKRSTHYPCQYIIGTQTFMGYEFEVCEGVLVPRPETELLVEKALMLTGEYKTDVRVLDMCCGSGCIGLGYKLMRKKQGYLKDELVLADISDTALSVSDRNSKRNNIECDIIKTDIFKEIKGRFNIILSNPPYIRTKDIDDLMEDVRLYEPRLALDGMADGLYFYRRIIEEAEAYLYEQGKIVFEIGYDQAEDIRALLVDNGYVDIEVLKDYAGLDRIISARRQ